MTPTQILILRRLEQGHATSRELADVVHITVHNTRVALHALRAQQLVHIRSWLTHTIPIWAKGARWDTPRPNKIGNERFKAYRRRHPQKYRDVQARYRARLKSRASKSSPECSTLPTLTAAPDTTST